MKIGTKFFISLAVPIVGAMSLFGYMDQRRSRIVLQEELAKEGRAMARSVQLAVEHALRDRQMEDVRHLVDQMSGFERILGVRVFDGAGALIYQSPGLEAVPMTPDLLRELLQGGTPPETRQRAGGKPIVTFTLPLSTAKGDRVGALQVLRLESFIEEDARASRNFLVVLTVLMIAATGIVLFLATQLSVARPVKALVKSFREVGSGDLHARIPVRRRDEFGHLAEEFNTMCERLDALQRSLLDEQEERRRMEARLRSAEHLASLGRLTAGLAHEIGTPLNVISGRAEGLLRKLSGTEPAGRQLRIISAQIDRIARIVSGMLDFSREREPRLDAVDVTAVVRKVLDFVEARLDESGVRTEAFFAEGLPAVAGDADQLQQVFLNLTLNAADAMPRGGILRIRAERLEGRSPEAVGPSRSCLAIAFEDTGQGIASELLDRVFEPFFTTKDIGRGTGLGLSVSYGIVREHGGWMQVESARGRGACVTVYLPAERDEASIPLKTAREAS